jgi:putative sterol carrier protein
MDDAQAIEERIRQGVDRASDAFPGVNGSYRFDVTDVGSWYLGIDSGVLTFRRGNEPADCVIESNKDDFWAIADGRQNLLTAAMQGRVHLDGDIAMAQKLHGLVGAPRPNDLKAAS